MIKFIRLLLPVLLSVLIAAVFVYLLNVFLDSSFVKYEILRPDWRNDPESITNFFQFIGIVWLFSVASLAVSWIVVRLFLNIKLTTVVTAFGYISFFLIFFGNWSYQAKVEQEYKLKTQTGTLISEDVKVQLMGVCFQVYLPTYKNPSLKGPALTALNSLRECENQYVLLAYFPHNSLGSEVLLKEKKEGRQLIRTVDQSKISFKAINGLNVEIEKGEEGYVDRDGLAQLPIFYRFTINQTNVELTWYKSDKAVMNDGEIEKIIKSLEE